MITKVKDLRQMLNNKNIEYTERSVDGQTCPLHVHISFEPIAVEIKHVTYDPHTIRYEPGILHGITYATYNRMASDCAKLASVNNFTTPKIKLHIDYGTITIKLEDLLDIIIKE